MKRMIQSWGLASSTFGLAVALSLVVGCAGNRYQASTGEYIDDTAITAKVKTALIGDKDVSAGDVSVETFKGVVQLSGFVDSNYERQKAEEIARAVQGVEGVENKISVK